MLLTLHQKKKKECSEIKEIKSHFKLNPLHFPLNLMTQCWIYEAKGQMETYIKEIYNKL